MHFRTMKGLMEYAQSPLHLKAWHHYNEIAKANPHIGIYHETYRVEADSFESVYANCSPFLLGQTKFSVVDDAGNVTWKSPLQNVSLKHKSAAGRMGKSDGNDLDKLKCLFVSVCYTVTQLYSSE